MNEKTKKLIFLLGLIVIVIVGGYAAIKALFPEDTQPTGPLYTTAEVTRGDLNVGVSAVGNLSSSWGGSIQVPYNGEDLSYKIEKMYVKSGDLVEAGQPILLLSSPSLGTQIETLQEQVDADRKSLANLLNIDESRVDFANADNGITMSAPIDGKISELAGKVGTKIESGTTICKVVDDSSIDMTVPLTAYEIDLVKEGQTKAVVRYGADTTVFEAQIVDVNRNPVAVKSGELTMDNGMAVDEDTYQFVYKVTLRAANPGLLFPGMMAYIGFYEPEDGYVFNGEIPENVRWTRYVSTVDQFTDEEMVISTVTGVISKSIVKDSAMVQKGDPICVISGQDVREDLESRLASYREKKNKLDNLLGQQDALTVTASVSGMIAELDKKEGDSVSSGNWIGSIFSADEMYMQVKIDDVDIVNVHVQAPVEITLDAIPDETFSGTVEYVSGYSDTSGGVSRYSVEIRLQGSTEMRAGMQARAYIASGSATDVLLIPAEAVFQEEGIYKVEVMDENQMVTVKNIEIGLMNDRFVEVRSGLEEGEVVVTGSTNDLLSSESVSGNGLLPSSGGKNDNSEDGDGDVVDDIGGADVSIEEPAMME